MRVALLVSAFNSLSQAVFANLKDRGYRVGVIFAIKNSQIKRELEEFSPDLVLAPFLKKYIAPYIYEKWPIFLFHPGPRGDRGPDSLEHALLSRDKRWGSVWLKISKEFDAGDIYAQALFDIREAPKASIYRKEVTKAALKTLPELFENILKKRSIPQKMEPIHRLITQKDRAIDWQKDSSEKIVKKINLSDSWPGVLDNIAGVDCYLFGAHIEEKLHIEFENAPIKSVIAKRNTAVCLKTVDGAIWVSHLMEPNRFKLPATYVLKSAIKGVKERRIPLIFNRSYKTFYEIWADERDEIAYLHFNFHNGAMSSDQCIRLKYAVEYLKERCKVLVLMGGEEFFSNGIHLNILEDSKKRGEDGWSNINAMNDLINSIMQSRECLTVASIGRNAGAGGVFLALACDFVVANEYSVLNPHYKTIGLSGSEYHSYTLPRRVGNDLSQKLLEEALPISTLFAKNIGMVDEVFEDTNYEERLESFCLELVEDLDKYYEVLDAKEERLDRDRDKIEESLKMELKIMHPQFWDENSKFHKLRHDFVYKVCPLKTPERFLLLK